MDNGGCKGNKFPYLRKLVLGGGGSTLWKLLNVILHKGDLNAVYQFSHPSGLMKCSWLFESDGCLETKEEHTELSELAIIISYKIHFRPQDIFSIIFELLQ